MTNKRLLLFGFFSFMIFLSIFAPAQLLGSLLGHFSAHRLGLAGSQGGLWKGNANLLLQGADAQDVPVDLGKVSWETQPLQLLAGRLSVSLSWNDGTPFWITQDASRLHVEHAAFNLPAELIPVLVPALKASQLGGQLAIRCNNFSLTRSEILGQVELDWSQASSPLSMVNPLGHYHARLDGHGGTLDIRIESPGDNPLMLQGGGRWSAGDGLHFEGIAEANATSRVQLQELLRVMGNETPSGSGRYQLKF